MKQERRAVPLVTKEGKLQIEQFLSHVSQWRRRHQTIMGNKPAEQLMQEWLLTQVCSNTELFAAKQLDSTRTNPTSTKLSVFLHRQRDLLAVRRGVARGAAEAFKAALAGAIKNKEGRRRSSRENQQPNHQAARRRWQGTDADEADDERAALVRDHAYRRWRHWPARMHTWSHAHGYQMSRPR